MTDGPRPDLDLSVNRSILRLDADLLKIRKVVSDFLKAAPAHPGRDTEGNTLTLRVKEVLILVASGPE